MLSKQFLLPQTSSLKMTLNVLFLKILILNILHHVSLAGTKHLNVIFYVYLEMLHSSA